MVNVPVFTIHSKGVFVEVIRNNKQSIYGLKEEQKLPDKADESEELKNILSKKIGTKILCLDTCEIFNSKREASSKYNLDRKSLNCVLNEENYSINNLHFEYYNGNSSKEYCSFNAPASSKNFLYIASLSPEIFPV